MAWIVGIIDSFDVRKAHYWALGPAISIIAILIFVAIAGVFSHTVIQKSLAKNFWTDEAYGLSISRADHYTGLTINGAQGQGSPAPLDYIFLKVLDDARNVFHLEWIPFNIYYRLNSFLWTLMAGAVVITVFYFYFRSTTGNYFILLLQVFLLAQALSYFYFKHEDLHFATETRPYALWNALWFCFMALFLFYREFNWVLWLVSVALALTSSGALFQLATFAICSFFFQWYDTKKFLPVFKNILFQFSLPLLISMYYSSKCPHFGYIASPESQQSYLKAFDAFWAYKFKTIVFAVYGITATMLFPKWRWCSAVFFTILFLYFLSPLCNHIILSKGLFFIPRQYLYYDLTMSIFILCISLMLPDFWEMLKNRYLLRRKI